MQINGSDFGVNKIKESVFPNLYHLVPELKTLSLSSGAITGTIPPQVHLLGRLEYLYFFENLEFDWHNTIRVGLVKHTHAFDVEQERVERSNSVAHWQTDETHQCLSRKAGCLWDHSIPDR